MMFPVLIMVPAMINAMRPVLRMVGMLAPVFGPCPMRPVVTPVLVAIAMAVATRPMPIVAALVSIVIPVAFVAAVLVVVESADRVDHHVGDGSTGDDFQQVVVRMIGVGCKRHHQRGCHTGDCQPADGRKEKEVAWI